MAGPAAEVPATPEPLRVSDAEREQAADELRKEFVEGRLSHDTFMFRMQTAFGSRNRAQLAGPFTDLPPRRPGPSTLLARMRDALPGAGLRPRTGQAAWPEPAAVRRLTFPPGSETTFTIGRSHECDLRIPDMSVSRLLRLQHRRRVHSRRRPVAAAGRAVTPGERARAGRPGRTSPCITLGRRDDRSAGATRAHRDDRSRADRVAARHRTG